MTEIRRHFEKLAELYGEIPQPPCNFCGKCCVTPHLTLVEFGFLLKAMLDNMDKEAIGEIIDRPLIPTVHIPGNYLCNLLDKSSKCLLYDFRPLGCRLEGLPVVTRMSGREQSLCVNPVITPAMQLVNQEQLENWIQSVFDDSGGHHAFSIEPWFFEAVNLECWWAILFDSNLTQKFFLNLRAALLDEYNVGNLREYYSDRTGFAKKVQLIEIFFRESESGKLEKAFKLIRRITQDFPNCGTYFQREGAEYFRLIKDIRQKRKGLNN